ncbi:MAG: DUF5060 domain-containing protein [Planctomycetota bacterium]
MRSIFATASAAVVCVRAVVAQVDVLYLFGSDPPAIHQMKLDDTGNLGMSQFAEAIEELPGVTITQAPAFLEDPASESPALTPAFLDQYEVLILGSNNKRFSADEADAVNAWVRGGGGLVAWSDSAFGGPFQNGGINNTVGRDSNNDLTAQFGMFFLRDNGAGVFEIRDYAYEHYLNDYTQNAVGSAGGNGVIFRGEGVSCIRVSAPAIPLAKLQQGTAGGNVRLNPNDNPFDPDRDVALAVAYPGLGRVVGTFDRNTFWNAGAGTQLGQFDNREFAQRLVAWAAQLDDPPTSGAVRGPLTEHQALTIDYAGPPSGEFATPNPFLDYRLQVTFVGPSTQTYSVPGYFAGDGNGGADGNVWRVKFAPDEPGDWTATASFRQGANVAVAVLGDETPNPSAGTPTAFDGAVNTFPVAPRDENAPGFLRYGRLEYNGTHYLRFVDGPAYVKGGADSPENWLGYTGFDNTSDFGAGPNTSNGLHFFPTHVADWNLGDPDWDSPDNPGPNDGRAIIGALNYLHSVGINCIYFLPMNIGGDGQDSWPYADPAINGDGSATNDNLRFDISKLEQWELFFGHSQAKGIKLHFVLNEAETPNKQELDNATLGTERRLFYRELIARFGHHQAIVWNISEEYNLNFNLGVPTVLEFARAIKGQDPFDRPVTVHNAGNPNNPNSGPWAPFIGQPDIDLTSIQNAGKVDGWGQVVEDYRAATTLAGKPLPVMIDEPGSPTRDIDSPGDFNEFRKRVIWDILLSGGGGEWFINNRDQSLEDFREFDDLWRFTTFCRLFVESLPFTEMDPANGLVTGESSTFGGAEVFAKPGEVYALYWPNTTATGSIDLSAVGGTLELRWYDPRNGVFVGGPIALTGGGVVGVPAPPSDPSEDWAAVITASGGEPVTATLTIVNGTIVDGGVTTGEFLVGTGVQIAAGPPPAGQVFGSWLASPPASIANPTASTTFVTIPLGGTTVTATFTDPPPGPRVAGYTIIDAGGTDLPIAPLLLGPNDVPDGAGLSLEANTVGVVGSVQLQLAVTGAAPVLTQTENVAPYALNGDSGGDFEPFGFVLSTGYTVTATAFSGSGGTGDPGPSLALDFSFRTDLACTADYNADGVFDADDLTEYLGDLAAQELSADKATPVGFVDAFDLAALSDLFPLCD